MRAKWIIAALVAAQLGIVALAQDKTTLDGVYTDAQAARGEAVYTKSCASCHQPDLAGDGMAPSLSGKDFNTDWVDQTMSDLFERTRISMPGDKPGSLQPNEVADVLAFLLSKGKFPAGQTELPPDAAALKGIKFVAPKG
jgi:S-disulfanyl-L-cysteine oxidoreductase SoxD